MHGYHRSGEALMKLAEPGIDARSASAWVENALDACLSRIYRREFFQQLVTTLLCAALCVLALRVTVQNYQVEGQSMQLTVLDGDRVLVDQIRYRISQPARGDIVVFLFPSRGSRLKLIKRMIGLPGDVVQIRPGIVQVNGQVVRESYVHFPEHYSYGPTRVPAGHYFVLGDNRWVSYDSHQWGYLPGGDIYGRVSVIYWPIRDIHWFGF